MGTPPSRSAANAKNLRPQLRLRHAPASWSTEDAATSEISRRTIHAAKQHLPSAFERPPEASSDFDRWIRESRFDTLQIGAINLRAFTELFLRESEFRSQSIDILSENFSGWHMAMMAALKQRNAAYMRLFHCFRSPTVSDYAFPPVGILRLMATKNYDPIATPRVLSLYIIRIWGGAGTSTQFGHGFGLNSSGGFHFE